MLGDIPKEQISQKMEKKIEFKEEKPGQTPKQKRLAENVHSRSKDKRTVQKWSQFLMQYISHYSGRNIF